MQFRRGVVLLLAGAFVVLAFASPSLAAIAKVKDVGTGAASNTTTVGVPVTVAAGGVAAGDLLIVSVYALGAPAETITVTDNSVGGPNIYNADVTVGPFGSGGNAKTVIFSTLVAHALAAADTITVTVNGPLGNGMVGLAVATEFSGVAASPLDKTATGTGSGAAAWATSATATTAQANELLIGATGSAETPTSSTPGASYTALPANTFGGAYGLFPEFRIVSAIGTYTASGTYNNASQNWGAAIATYKDVTAPVELMNFGAK